MTTSATEVLFDDDTMWVGLSDGRTLGVPVAGFPRRLNATPQQRAAVTISPFGLHWEALDEDLSIEGMLSGERHGVEAASPHGLVRQAPSQTTPP